MKRPAGWLAPDWSIAGVAALMTTRDGGKSSGRFATMNLRERLGDDDDAVRANQATLASAIGARPVYLDQVHGHRVVQLGAGDALAGAAVHRADAAFTTEPGIACVAQVADCLPVLFAARNGRAVGAAHAGWRGLAAGVVEATATRVAAAAGCSGRDLVAWLGPCIGPDRFEVGADVLEAFGAEAPTPRFRPTRPGKWLADLPGLARDRLAAMVVADVTGGTWCTVSDASRFFSFRRDGVTGRMAAAVALVATSAERR